MLRYLNDNKDCNAKFEAKDTNGYLKKCNTSLYKTATSNTKLLLYKRCLYMTFDEYTSDKVHINKNMYCRVFDSVNERELKNTIQAELENIRGNLLRPSYLKIPLPIYVMLAKKLENMNNDSVFKGNYTVVLYIPNLFDFNGEGKEYTLFPSLDAFSKQNRWMELITSQTSKFLDVIEIGSLKEKDDKVRKKNYLRTDLTNTCYNLGCVSSEKETFMIPSYSTNDAEISASAENLSPYYPKKCLKTPYYNKHMMDFSPADEIRFRGTGDVLSDDFDANIHCSAENMEIYKGQAKKDEERFDVFLCKQLTACKMYDGNEDPDYDNAYDRVICKEKEKKRVELLLSDFYRKNIESGTGKKEYSSDYNDNILKELAFRRSKYPSPGKIQEIVFSMFRLNESIFDEDLFCYMPWGNILLKQDYVLNDSETIQIDKLPFKSFNGAFEMKFARDGYLSIFRNGQFHSRVPNQRRSFKCYTNRVLSFENTSIVILGYDEHNNYDQRGYISLDLKAIHGSPASVILSNSGRLMLYDLGINRKM